MSTNPYQTNILIVEDNPTTAMIYSSYLDNDYSVTTAATGQEALDYFRQGGFDLVMLDLTLPDTDGITLLKDIRGLDDHTPVIIVTSDYSSEQVITALRHKANDYLTKPIERTRLLVTISNALREFDLSQRINALTQNTDNVAFHGMIGRSLAITNVFETIRSSAGSRAAIFITGESGTGKELCAEAIHLESDRRHKPFIAINCAAIPRELIESELFGHVKGAFTGANSNRVGAAQRADGGTLFLDEIGELPIDLQSKLLRFIQTQQLQPVGSDQLVQVDVRFVCATNRNPKQAVAEGLLREDLYYRLNVIPIQLPPLRERGNDVILMARQFLRDFSVEERKQFQRFAPAVESVLNAYRWPGNIRQLSNIIRKIVVLHDGEIVTPQMLPSELLEAEKFAVALPVVEQQHTSSSDLAAFKLQPLEHSERQIIEFTLSHCKGNIRAAAQILEVSPSTLYRKIERWQQRD
ncbi:sigma-54-dependent transcriptional regulator [Pseudidiomarina mangrovi]|uniref:sigma-54-dependent transcriptional regulator n=1 Tax=Pseudidiomarina mangrovi TaxID=2487133 RepID=UPI000FCAC88A|nr:sigma-54 dependent transcriptional regulator [Pseudidiomarina mangrovi]